mmetsp:Transcript_10027/g.22290  ORF Transcript_10027/g.22290 Transcript_10027/m.22290 type:complete len:223 (-) Transcript_10027:626-1294(-)
MHHLHPLFGPELHFNDSSRLQNATPAVLIGVHLHDIGIDGWIHHHPGAPTEFALRGNVNEDGLFVIHQGIHNLSSEFQDFSVHVSSSSRETTPIGKDHQRKIFAHIEVPYGCGCLVGTVRKPHLSCLRLDNLSTLWIAGISRYSPFNIPGLDCYDTHGDAPQACSTYYYTSAPTSHVFNETSSVEETRKPFAISRCRSSQHVPRIIRLFRRSKLHGSVERVC